MKNETRPDFRRAQRAPLFLAAAAATLALIAPALAQAQHAHSHGSLELTVAVEAQSITIDMEAPLDNFVGFERAPRTDGERQRVADMLARLNAADTLFVPDPKAGCSLSKVTLASQVLGLGDKAAAADAKAADAHADIDVSIRFSCTSADLAQYVDVKLLDAFKRVKRVHAQVATRQGQFKRILTVGKPQLTWGR